MKKAILIAVGINLFESDWGDAVDFTPPLGIVALGSYLAAHDVPVELIDVQVDFGFGLTHDTEREVFQRVVQYLSDQADSIAWIGLSQLGHSNRSVTLAREIRAAFPEMSIIFGGYYASMNYRSLLKKNPSIITAIVRSDGEAAALQISRSLAQGQSFLSDQTPNLAWLDGGEIRTSPVRTMPLDRLPILDFGLLRNKSRYVSVGILTSRGCPFRCNFCPENVMRPYAAYPTTWVVQQLEHMEVQFLDMHTHIAIYDSTFGLDRKRMLEMCQVLRKYAFAYVAQTRVDVSTADLVPILGEAGIELLSLGIESASAATLLRMNKVQSASEAKDYIKHAREVLKACFENNVLPLPNFVLGFPGDSEADLQATLEFAREMVQLHNQVVTQTGVEVGFASSVSATMIVPGTRLAECLGRDYPEVVLYAKRLPFTFLGGSRLDMYSEEALATAASAKPADWSRAVLWPSPELGPDVIYQYQEEIQNLEIRTSKLLELTSQFVGSPVKNLVTAHPELTDEQGVTVLCDRVQQMVK